MLAVYAESAGLLLHARDHMAPLTWHQPEMAIHTMIRGSPSLGLFWLDHCPGKVAPPIKLLNVRVLAGKRDSWKSLDLQNLGQQRMPPKRKQAAQKAKDDTKKVKPDLSAAVDKLLEKGASYCEELDIDMENGGDALFQWLCASIIFRWGVVMATMIYVQ